MNEKASAPTESRDGERPDASVRRRGGALVGQVARAMARRFEALKREAGLGDIGSGEGRVVYLLWRHGPMRQGELAARADIDKSTLALTLARMERKGLIVRRADERDGRVSIVALGPASENRAGAFEAVSAAMVGLFYRGFTAAEIDAFEAALERISANLAEPSR